MNKVVILIFIIIVGAVLIGVPLYGFFNPQVLMDYDRRSAEAVASQADVGALTAQFSNTVWTTSETVQLNTGHGQRVPVVFDCEITLAPEGKLKCKAHLFSDVPLPPQFQALKSTLEAGWEGTWQLSKGGELLRVKIDNPVANFRELNAAYPLTQESLRVQGNGLTYTATGLEYRELNRLH